MVISRSSARLRPPASTSPTSRVSRGWPVGCSRRRTGLAAAQSAASGARHRMDGGQQDQPELPYRGRRGGANRRIQVFYNAQDLVSGAMRRLVRIQGDTPNFIIPRRTYDANDPYVALVVNTDWYGVQALLAPDCQAFSVHSRARRAG